MQDQFSTEEPIPPGKRNARPGILSEQQQLATSIEQDFRTLLESLGVYQSIADSRIAAHIEKVKAVVERGIDLTLRLRKMTDAGS